jgi:chemotaxis protein methyltransferase CheR
MPFQLSPALFTILSTLVEDRLGLHFNQDDRELFAAKVAARAREAGFESGLDYYYFLRYDPGANVELDALADALVVGETYFFRELDALRASTTHVVAPIIASRGTARIWSAGCATGEEPLSLAMVLEEAGLLDRCRIIATDISTRALSKAREGSYGTRSLRVLPPNSPPAGFTERLGAIAERSLVREGASRAQVARSLTHVVDFRQLNLIDDAAVAALGSFDLVLCRNVLIYFADATVKRVVSSFAKALRADGRLLIGASESLLRFGTVLQCEERGGTFFYGRGAG